MIGRTSNKSWKVYSNLIFYYYAIFMKMQFLGDLGLWDPYVCQSLIWWCFWCCFGEIHTKKWELRWNTVRIKYRNHTFDEYFNDSCSIKGRTRCFNFQSKKNYSTTNIALTRDTLKMFSCFCEKVVSWFFYRYFLLIHFFVRRIRE